MNDVDFRPVAEYIAVPVDGRDRSCRPRVSSSVAGVGHKHTGVQEEAELHHSRQENNQKRQHYCEFNKQAAPSRPLVLSLWFDFTIHGDQPFCLPGPRTPRAPVLERRRPPAFALTGW